MWRPGSGLTPRRLLVLIRSLPPDALFWAEYGAELKRAEEQAKVDQIRARTAHYAKQAATAEEGS